MAESLLLEVHSHLAAVIELGNKPHLDSFPLHIFTVCNSTIYFHGTLPPKHVMQKEFPQVQPKLAYHTARIINPVTYQGVSMAAHFHMLLYVCTLCSAVI